MAGEDVIRGDGREKEPGVKGNQLRVGSWSHQEKFTVYYTEKTRLGRFS